MAQCQFIKKDGSRCKGRVKEGSTFCVFHQPKSASEPESTLTEEESVPAIHSKASRRIRFTAKGTYQIPNGYQGHTVDFREKGQVEYVDHDVWTHLLESQPEAFEEA